jgi:TonB family protein
VNRAVSAAALAALLMAAAPPEPTARGFRAAAMRIASFHAGPVRCGGQERVPVRALSPLPTASAAADAGEPIRFGFRIDPDGRPLGIRRIGSPGSPALDERDLAPALTAWRFAPGTPQADCEIGFTVQLDSVESADEPLLQRYAALGRMQIPGSSGAALVGRAFARLRPPGATCLVDPVPRAPIALSYRQIPELPGGISYSLFSYDVDAAGKPVHIRLLGSSGNRALDIAGDGALGAARFPAAPLTGCLYYFFRNDVEGVPAPPEPPEQLHPRGSACDEEIARRAGAGFHIRYPIEFLRRPAEAWVVLGYDVEPSGELSNLRVIESEPAARFGEEVLRAAAEVRVTGVERPQRGCTQRVRFVVPGR